MSKPDKQFYEFGNFQLDRNKRLLRRAGEVLPLTPKAFDTLLTLVENRSRVLDKEELMQAVWGETIVEESGLARNISVLRKTLGESKDAHQFIVTVPGRGYRFVADVQEVAAAETMEMVLEETKVRVVIEEETKEDRERERGREGERERQKTNASTRVLMAPAVPVSIAILALLLVGAAYWWRVKFPANFQGQKAYPRTLAVLPFKTLPPHPEEEYLGVGLADVMITRLGSLQQLIVRPTRAVLPFATQDPLQAGQSLKVEAVLDGSIQQEGERVRVTVRLLRVADGQALWSYQYDEAATNAFKLQDIIAQRVTESLALELTSEERARLAKRYTENGEAYQFYLKGLYLYNQRTEAGMQKALTFFQQATEHDPNYALAWAGIADTWLNLPPYSVTAQSSETYQKAKAAAEKALQIDDQLAEAYVSRAFVYDRHEWDWTAAERAYRRAIELNPNLAAAHHRYGMHLLARLRFDEALTELQRAQSLDPLSLIIGVNVAMCFLYTKQYDLAIAHLKQTLTLESRFAPGQHVLGWAYEGKGMEQEAITAYLQAHRLARASDADVAALQTAFQQAGLRGYYQQHLRQLQQQAQQHYVSPLHLATLYARLGETESALAELEKAYAERNADMMTIKVDWHFDSLRNNPRFVDLLRRVGLTP